MSSGMNLGEKPRSTIRTASYSIEEDQLLCHIYLDVSQNLILGTNQSSLQFWSRIETEYHKAKPEHITHVRPKRSLQSRMQVIMSATRKLRGYVQQIENLKPSGGASELDVLNQAKALLAEDPDFKKQYKFDHVWPLLKDSNLSMLTPGRRKRNDWKEASQSDSTTPKSAGGSPFCIDLNADFESERPVGSEEMIKFYKSLKEENQQIKDMFKESNACMQETQSLLQMNYQLQLLRAQNEAKKLELRERREENKILNRDLDSIKDPMLRDALRSEQMRIYEKRAQVQGGSGSSNTRTDGGSGALLRGCLLYKRLDLAQNLYKELVEVDPESSGGYVMLANTFAENHRWGDVSELRRFMRENRVKKHPGCSWISIGGVVHEFLVGSLSHPEIERIYHLLDGLLKEMKIASH
ncbi:hypothetical protein Ddye_003511 [Dipteronia dyeriana]|uniref:Uncharacterized protein n=1 Tax=Dipteronia dyeriana TaxID=168575 RepID=A0AAD9XTM3_9ROSI|nr:hypothetical protein Ddye_003511 [Dipteronia dyeriana]